MTLVEQRIRAVLFDLDGTLIDSRPGIESSASAALEEVGLDPDTPIEAAWLSAPLAGLMESLMPGSDADEREQASRAFMRHYDDTGWKASQPYPGIELVLERLDRAGLRSFVLTNKRRVPAMAILEHHALIERFEAVYTLDSRDPRYDSKREMGQACIEEHTLVPSSTLVVGDSPDDLDVARGCGTVFGAASWGYGGVAIDDRSQTAGSDGPSGSSDILLAAPTDLEMLIQEPAGGQSQR